MKLSSNICNEMLQTFLNDTPKICESVFTPKGIIPFSKPILSSEYKCEWCGNTMHYHPCVDPNISDKKAWLCENEFCDVNKDWKDVKISLPINKDNQGLLWPLFCEINGIGDIHHDVKFEKVEQNEAKISYMRKFVDHPRSIIVMQGEKGTGKTYAAMAICEYFTRKSKSCIFTTQKEMSNNWLIALEDKYNNYVSKISCVNLLVIDDFGLSEPTPKFLDFFMSIINLRMQWTNRGTIITTNLDVSELASYCKEALSDRLNTGILFEFHGDSRRKQIIY